MKEYMYPIRDQFSIPTIVNDPASIALREQLCKASKAVIREYAVDCALRARDMAGAKRGGAVEMITSMWAERRFGACTHLSNDEARWIAAAQQTLVGEVVEESEIALAVESDVASDSVTIARCRAYFVLAAVAAHDVWYWSHDDMDHMVDNAVAASYYTMQCAMTQRRIDPYTGEYYGVVEDADKAAAADAERKLQVERLDYLSRTYDERIRSKHDMMFLLLSELYGNTAGRYDRCTRVYDLYKTLPKNRKIYAQDVLRLTGHLTAESMMGFLLRHEMLTDGEALPLARKWIGAKEAPLPSDEDATVDTLYDWYNNSGAADKYKARLRRAIERHKGEYDKSDCVHMILKYASTIGPSYDEQVSDIKAIVASR